MFLHNLVSSDIASSRHSARPHRLEREDRHPTRVCEKLLDGRNAIVKDAFLNREASTRGCVALRIFTEA